MDLKSIWPKLLKKKSVNNKSLKNGALQKLVSIFTIGILISTTLHFVVQDNFAGVGEPEPSGATKSDWIIEEGDEIIIEYETIRLNGDLIIKPGGKLSFEYVTLLIDHPEGDSYEIIIESSTVAGKEIMGELIVTNSEITVVDPTDLGYYNFKSYGKLTIKDSTISYIGETSSVGGIEIYSDYVNIENSIIENCESMAIYAEKNPVLIGNTFRDNVYGIYYNNVNERFSSIANYKENDEFGKTITTASDLNGDGIDDIVVGAPYNDNNDIDSGAVFIFYGDDGFDSNDLTVDNADLVYYGFQANGYFGSSITSAGDLNGDGLNDLLIGASGEQNGDPTPLDTGKVYVHFSNENGIGEYILNENYEDFETGILNDMEIFDDTLILDDVHSEFIITDDLEFQSGTLDYVSIENKPKTDIVENREFTADIHTNALWHFNENEGTVAKDSTIHNNDADLIDDDHGNSDGDAPPKWVQNGYFDYGLEFDGTDDYVSITDDNSLDFVDEISIDVWIFPYTEFSIDNQYILNKGQISSSCNYMLRTGSGSDDNRMELEFGFYNGASNIWKTTTQPISKKELWYHITVNYNGISDPEIFVNRKLQSGAWSNGGIAIMVSNANDIYIGSDGSNYFKGIIDEIRISDIIRKSEDDMIDSITIQDGEYSIDKYTNAIWHFNERKGSIAFDETVNGNDGSLYLDDDGSGSDQLPIWTRDGYFDYGLKFDGTNDYVQVSDDNALDINNHLTIDIWIYPEVNNVDNQYVFTKGDISSSCNYMLRTGSGTSDNQKELEFGFYGGSSNIWRTSTKPINTIETWYHITITYDEINDPILFINGIKQSGSWSTGGINNFPTSDPNELYIGANSDSPPINNFKGIIDELRISNTIRRSGHNYNIIGNLNEYNPDENTRTLFHLNENTGTTIYDESINGVKGTLGDGTVDYEPSWIDGYMGSCLDFDGADDYVWIDYNPMLEIHSDLTIEAWINWDNENDEVNTIVAAPKSFWLWIEGRNGNPNEGKLVFEPGKSPWNDDLVSTSAITPGKWTHVAITRVGDGSGTDAVCIYIDGDLDAVGSVLKSEGTTPETSIGAWTRKSNSEFDHYFDGKIDELHISSAVKTEFLTNDYFKYEREYFVETDMIGLWHLDEGTGTSVNDETGLNQDGTINGGETWIAEGKFGNSLEFDGTNDYIEIPHNSNQQVTDITAEAWVKFDSLSTGDYVIIGKDESYKLLIEVDSYGDYYLNGMIYITGTGWVGINDFSNAKDLSFLKNRWVHLAFSFDSSTETIKTYINGDLDTSRTYSTATIAGSSHVLSIGCLILSSSVKEDYFTGIIDEVAIFDFVKPHFNQDYLTDAHTLSLFHLDRGSGLSVGDSSQYSSKGTLYDGTDFGGTWSTGYMGGCLDFDGSNDYILVEDINWANEISNEFTIDLWAYIDSTLTNSNYILVQMENSFIFELISESSEYHLTGTIYLSELDESLTITDFSSSVDLLDSEYLNSWHHFAISFDGDRLTSFVDGKFDAMVINPTSYQSINIGSNNMYIGVDSTLTDYYNGKLDEIRISDMARPSEAYHDGIFISPVLDAIKYSSFDEIAWYFESSDKDKTNALIQVRSSDALSDLYDIAWYGPTSTCDYYYNSPSEINVEHFGDRYMQFKVILQSLDPIHTLSLDEIRIKYHSYVGSGDYISSLTPPSKPIDDIIPEWDTTFNPDVTVFVHYLDDTQTEYFEEITDYNGKSYTLQDGPAEEIWYKILMTSTGARTPEFDSIKIYYSYADEGSQAFELGWGIFGDYIASGDLNGDNYDDVIIGDPITDTVNIYFGGTTLDFGLDVVVNGIPAGDFGTIISILDDLDEDGTNELLIGDKANGEVYLYYGDTIINDPIGSPPSLGYGDADITFMSTKGTNNFGACIAGGGNYDGDLYPDVLISDPLNNEVYVYSGLTILNDADGNLDETSTDRDVLILKETADTGNDFGFEIMISKDINQDMYDDIVVTQPGKVVNSESDVGAAYIFFGAESLTSTLYAHNADFKYYGESSTGRYGESLCFGNLNNDQYYEIITGAPSFDSDGLVDVGKLYLESILGHKSKENEIYNNNYGIYLNNCQKGIYKDMIYNNIDVGVQSVGSSIVIDNCEINEETSDYQHTVSDGVYLDNTKATISSSSIYSLDATGIYSTSSSAIIKDTIISESISEFIDNFNNKDQIDENPTKTHNVYINEDYGTIELEPDNYHFNEKWADSEFGDWTKTTIGNGGTKTQVQDFWDESGDDLYLEGEADESSSLDGGVIFSKEIDLDGEGNPRNYVLQAQTHGIVNFIYFYETYVTPTVAQMKITIYDDDSHTNSKTILYSTFNPHEFSDVGDPSWEENQQFYYKANGNIFEYVAKLPDFDITIDNEIGAYFESHFGSIGWADIHSIEIELRSTEAKEDSPYDPDPKLYSNYVRIENPSEISDSYKTSGKFESTIISLRNNNEWDMLYITKNDPMPEDYNKIKISVLDGTGAPISGYQDLIVKEIDLSGLNPGTQSIKLKAVFTGDGTFTSTLYDWKVTFKCTNDLSLKCIGSTSIIIDSEISSDNDNDLDLSSTSKVTLIGTSIVDSKINFNSDTLSSVVIKWYLNLQIINRQESIRTVDDRGTPEDPLDDLTATIMEEIPQSDLWVEVFESGGANRIFKGETDIEGKLTNIICREMKLEYDALASYKRTYHSPNTIKVYDETSIVQNNVEIYMAANKDIILNYGSDSDDDLLIDAQENNPNVLWLEAEDFFETESQLYDDVLANYEKSIMESDSSDFIIDNLIKLPLSSTSDFRVMIRAKKIDTEEGNIYVKLDVKERGVSILTSVNSFLLTTDYRFLTSEVFTVGTPDGYIEIEVLDQNTNPSVILDRIIIYEDQSVTPGQLSDPLNIDSDKDYIPDGLEIRLNTLWFEAEDYPDTPTTPIEDDDDASNSKRVKQDPTSSETINIPGIGVQASKYRYYVRAKSIPNPSDETYDDFDDPELLGWDRDFTSVGISYTVYDPVEEEWSLKQEVNLPPGSNKGYEILYTTDNEKEYMSKYTDWEVTYNVESMTIINNDWNSVGFIIGLIDGDDSANGAWYEVGIGPGEIKDDLFLDHDTGISYSIKIKTNGEKADIYRLENGDYSLRKSIDISYFNSLKFAIGAYAWPSSTQPCGIKMSYSTVTVTEDTMDMKIKQGASILARKKIPVTDKFEWYQMDFTPASGTVDLFASAISTSKTLYVDKVAIVKEDEVYTNKFTDGASGYTLTAPSTKSITIPPDTMVSETTMILKGQSTGMTVVNQPGPFPPPPPPASFDQENPDIYETFMVYEQFNIIPGSNPPTGYWNIYFSPNIGPGYYLNPGPVEQRNPAIYGNIVVWQEQVPSTPPAMPNPWYICVHDLNSLPPKIPTNNIPHKNTGLNFLGVPIDHINPAVYGDKVVWQENSDSAGNFDIYMYDMDDDNDGLLNFHEDWYVNNDDGDCVGGNPANPIINEEIRNYINDDNDYWADDPGGIPENYDLGIDEVIWDNPNTYVGIYDAGDIILYPGIDGVPSRTHGDPLTPLVDEDIFDPGEILLVGGFGIQETPKIYENSIVFVEDVVLNGLPGVGDIKLATFTFDGDYSRNTMGLKINTLINVDMSGFNRLPNIFGDNIVYCTPIGLTVVIDDIPSLITISQICKYNIKDGKKIYISGQPTDKLDIYGLTIVYDESFSTNIVAYNFNLQLSRDITLKGSGTFKPALYAGRIVFEDFIAGAPPFKIIELFTQEFYLDVGNDGTIDWESKKVIMGNEWTPNLYKEVNKYLEANGGGGGSIPVPLVFTSSSTPFTLQISNLNVYMDIIVDPLDIDTDGDSLWDGDELYIYGGYDILEAEDTLDFKPWYNPKFDINANYDELPDTKSNVVKINGVNVPVGNFIHQTDVTLTSSNNYGLSDGVLDSYIKLTVSTDKTGFYRFKINPMLENEMSISFDSTMRRSILEPVKKIYWTENDHAPFNPHYYTTYDTKGIDIHVDSDIDEYIEKVIELATYVEVRGAANELIPVDNTLKITPIIKDLKFASSIKGMVGADDGSPIEQLYITAEYYYEGVYELVQQNEYEIKIGIDLGRTIGMVTPPASLPQEISFLRLNAIDSVRVERMGLNALARDSDGDGLDDGIESFDNTLYALTSDADRDGLNDYDELMVYGTNPGYRDSDYDCIRDAVELGKTYNWINTNKGETESPGSWIERVAHWNDPWNIAPINNHDADLGATMTDPLSIDTDDDGLPDGWIDGWTYDSTPFDTINAKTFATNDNRYENFNFWRYDNRYWQFGGEIDNLFQVYEGEDFNMDGAADLTGSWGFNEQTFEILDNVNRRETDASTANSDSDDMPDGYEVWYSHIEPFTVVSSLDTILDPTYDDGGDDIDVALTETSINSFTGSASIQLGPSTRALAQRINLGSSNKQITKIKVQLTNFQDMARMELWSSRLVAGLHMPNEILGVYDIFVPEDNNWYPVDVKDDILDTTAPLFIVMRYVSNTFDWKYSTSGGSTGDMFQQLDSGEWISMGNDKASYDVMTIGSVGDSLDNNNEYIIGTNPKDPDMDREMIGTKEISDGLTDGEEIFGKAGDTTTGGVIFRTNVPYGAVSFEHYSQGSGSIIYYDGDGLRGDLSCFKYDYERYVKDPDSKYKGTFPTNHFVAKLEDGSKIFLSPDSGHEYIYIWSPGTYLGEYKYDYFGNLYQPGECYVFKKTGASSMGDYKPDLAYRNQEFYLSSPFEIDTDNDGIKDGFEIEWYRESQSEIDNSNKDWRVNVRDEDSDNDGINDGDEVAWMVDTDGDGAQNMVDEDSDDDGLWDGDELLWSSDTDGDGGSQTLAEYTYDGDHGYGVTCSIIDALGLQNYEYNDGMNMLDKDSDADGLADGWIDGYIYDWEDGVFRDYDTEYQVDYNSYLFPVENNGRFDPWEGECAHYDRDGYITNGVVYDEGRDTSPIEKDSDHDGLFDGFDIYSDPFVRSGDPDEFGELYYYDYTNTNGMPFSGGNFLRPYQQTKNPVSTNMKNTNQLLKDTDADGLTDFKEVYPWDLSVQDWISPWDYYTVPRPPILHVLDISTDPNDPDTENDELTDGEEFHKTNPLDKDSDNDGLTDKFELKEGTNPVDRDSDDDYSCDGWNDGWDGTNTIPKPNAIQTIDATNECVWDEADWSTNPDPWTNTNLGEFGEAIVDASGEIVFKTSPYIADGDGDNVLDGTEFAFLWGNDINEPYIDSDNDGTIDLYELDSDNDGKTDGEENYNHDYQRKYKLISGTKYYLESDPTNWDSDLEGLLDGAEPAWLEDTDEDNLINVMDQDSNEPDAVINSDYDEVYVVFRTNAIDGDGDGYLNFNSNTWIAVDYNAYSWLENVDGLSTPSPNDPEQKLELYVYDYIGTVKNPSPIPSKTIDICYGANPTDEPITTSTPGGYDIFVTGYDDTKGGYDFVWIKIDSTTYVKYGNPHTDLTKDKINSIPDANDHIYNNFVVNHQETYDIRVAINMDKDFDSIPDLIEDRNGDGDYDPAGLDGIMYTADDETDKWDRDTDDDGIMDGDEWIDTNEDDLLDENDLIYASDPDSDDDGITDGTEAGVTQPVKSIGANIKGTDETALISGSTRKCFTPDSDSSTTTNPRLSDSDADGLLDGWDDSADEDGIRDSDEDEGEDLNYNGQVDFGEADPNDFDSDDDGVRDGDVDEGVDSSTHKLYDSDNDNIINALDPDSDNDMIFDGTELGFTMGQISKDTDISKGNFIPDANPIRLTDPKDPDTDNDGLWDGVEDSNQDGAVEGDSNMDHKYQEWEYWTETDPRDADSDDDWLWDGYSTATHEGELTHGTKQTFPDSDYDGLSDGDEVNGIYIWGDNPDMGIIYTNPMSIDTDGDGLSDGIEVRGWPVTVFWEATGEIFSGPHRVYSHPNPPASWGDDPDGNGLNDFLEFQYLCDPNSEDTDLDYIHDNVEATDSDPSSPVGIEGTPPVLDKLDVESHWIYSGWKIVGVYTKASANAFDNAGLYSVRFNIAGYNADTYYFLNKPQSGKSSVTYSFDLGKYAFTGYDISATAIDWNSNYITYSTHIDSQLENLAELDWKGFLDNSLGFDAFLHYYTQGKKSIRDTFQPIFEDIHKGMKDWGPQIENVFLDAFSGSKTFDDAMIELMIEIPNILKDSLLLSIFKPLADALNMVFKKIDEFITYVEDEEPEPVIIGDIFQVFYDEFDWSESGYELEPDQESRIKNAVSVDESEEIFIEITQSEDTGAAESSRSSRGSEYHSSSFGYEGRSPAADFIFPEEAIEYEPNKISTKFKEKDKVDDFLSSFSDLFSVSTIIISLAAWEPTGIALPLIAILISHYPDFMHIDPYGWRTNSDGESIPGALTYSTFATLGLGLAIIAAVSNVIMAVAMAVAAIFTFGVTLIFTATNLIFGILGFAVCNAKYWHAREKYESLYNDYDGDGLASWEEEVVYAVNVDRQHKAGDFQDNDNGQLNSGISGDIVLVSGLSDELYNHDMDNDGILDGPELFPYRYSVDDLNELYYYHLGLDSFVNTYVTNPIDDDSDNDGKNSIDFNDKKEQDGIGIDSYPFTWNSDGWNYKQRKNVPDIAPDDQDIDPNKNMKIQIIFEKIEFLDNIDLKETIPKTPNMYGDPYFNLYVNLPYYQAREEIYATMGEGEKNPYETTDTVGYKAIKHNDATAEIDFSTYQGGIHSEKYKSELIDVPDFIGDTATIVFWGVDYDEKKIIPAVGDTDDKLHDLLDINNRLNTATGNEHNKGCDLLYHIEIDPYWEYDDNQDDDQNPVQNGLPSGDSDEEYRYTSGDGDGAESAGDNNLPVDYDLGSSWTIADAKVWFDIIEV